MNLISKTLGKEDTNTPRKDAGNITCYKTKKRREEENEIRIFSLLDSKRSQNSCWRPGRKKSGCKVGEASDERTQKILGWPLRSWSEQTGAPNLNTVKTSTMNSALSTADCSNDDRGAWSWDELQEYLHSEEGAAAAAAGTGGAGGLG